MVISINTLHNQKKFHESRSEAFSWCKEQIEAHHDREFYIIDDGECFKIFSHYKKLKAIVVGDENTLINGEFIP